MDTNDQVSVFSGGDQTIEITLFFIVRKNKYGVNVFKVLDDKELEELQSDENKKKTIRSINTVWSLLGWKQQNEYLEKSIEINPVSSAKEINPTKYRETIFKKCLKDWDIIENGKKIPVSDMAIDKLDPRLGEALLNKYDTMMSFDEAAQGN